MNNIFPNIKNYDKATTLSFYIVLLLRLVNNTELYYYYYPSAFVIMVSGLLLKSDIFNNVKSLFDIKTFTYYILPLLLIHPYFYKTNKKKQEQLNKNKFLYSVISIVIYNIYLYLLNKNIIQVYGNQVFLAILISLLLILIDNPINQK